MSWTLTSNEYTSTYSTPYSATIKTRLIALGFAAVPSLLNVWTGHRFQMPEKGRYSRAAFECHVIEVLGAIGDHQAFNPLLQIMETALAYPEPTSIWAPLPLQNAPVRQAIAGALVKLSSDLNDVKAFLALAEAMDGRYVEVINKVGLLESKMSNDPKAALYIKNWVETHQQKKK